MDQTDREIVYSTLDWSDEQLTKIQADLRLRGISHSIDDGLLVVDKSAEPHTDRIITDTTGVFDAPSGPAVDLPDPTALSKVDDRDGVPDSQISRWMATVPRAGGGSPKKGRLLEIYERIACTDETPLLSMRAELVSEKQKRTVFGGTKTNDTATFQSGAAVLTDKRFYMETRLMTSRDSQTIMLRDVQGVTRQTGFANMQDMIEIRTAGGSTKFSVGLRNKHETNKIIDVIQTAASNARKAEMLAKQTTIVNQEATPSKSEQLKELFALKQSGAITDAEFTALKREVLEQQAE